MSENYRKEVTVYSKFCNPVDDISNESFKVYRPHSMRQVNAVFELNRLVVQLEAAEANADLNRAMELTYKEQLEQMKPYMKHRFHCVWHKANCQNKCTCGLQAILEKDNG
jgi:hypothetical protein